MCWWGWGGVALSFFKLDFNVIIYLLQFLSELNNIFHMKDLKRSTFYVKLIDDRRRPNKKNIESLDMTRKVDLLRL